MKFRARNQNLESTFVNFSENNHCAFRIDLKIKKDKIAKFRIILWNIQKFCERLVEIRVDEVNRALNITKKREPRR